MEKTRELESQVFDIDSADSKQLILFNDEINDFDFVISSLMEVCLHTHEQAEQCAMIAHYKGKCAVRNGTFVELKPMYDALTRRNLTMEIK